MPEAGATSPSADGVLTFGETMVALRGSGPLKLGGTMNVSVAGAESNVAIGLARLGHTVRWAGVVGDDEAGELVLRTLRAEGVDISGAQCDPQAPTGLILFEPRLPDVTRVHYYRTGSAGSRLTTDTVEQAFATRPPRLLHLTGITPALSSSALAASRRALDLARTHRSVICLDVNFRSRLWSAEEASVVLGSFVPYVDVLIASEDELPLCLPPRVPPSQTGSAAAGTVADATTAVRVGQSADASARASEAAEQAGLLLSLGIKQVVIKLGADGAVCHTAQGAVHRTARPVRAVDTVGAGDAFVAGYLSGLLDGEDIAARLDRAVTTGAFAVASAGDWEGAPTRTELALLSSTPGTVIR